MPQTLGDSTAAAELVMTTIAVKKAMAHRIQAEELRQMAHGPSRLHPDATAVLHGAAPIKAMRGTKYLAMELAIAQDANAAKKIGTVKVSEALHNAGILTKPLQGEELV